MVAVDLGLGRVPQCLEIMRCVKCEEEIGEVHKALQIPSYD